MRKFVSCIFMVLGGCLLSFAQHPSLLFTQEEVSEIRAGKGMLPEFDKSLSEVLSAADAAVNSSISVPVPIDGGGGAVHEQHKSNYYAMFHCGVAYQLTGDKKYVDFLNREYRATYDFLFDKEEHLFYRDSRYFNKKEANGKKVFWGRGNGWVLGGLSEILQALPAKDKHRRFYEDLFVTLSARVAELQSKDGYWHASLLDPESYPSPETSATGFIVYALAYGINEGLLDKDKFTPVVVKGWQAMLDAVSAEGKLGYVQPIGADPRKVTREMTEVYGVGAFLLAGNQIYKMAQ